MRRKLLIVFIVGLTLTFCEGSSIAQLQKKQGQRDEQKSDWSVSLGAIGMFTPEYEGSKDYKLQGFPMIDINWRDMFFLNPRKGIGAYLWNRDGVKVGGSIGYALGRDEDDSSDLDGLGDIESGATANILFEWKVNDFSFDAHYEQQFAGTDTGFQIHTAVGYNMRFGRKIIFKPSVTTTYASSDYMEKYFSVSQSQSSRSGLSVYDTNSGFKSVGLNIISIYILDRHWAVQTIAGCNLLVGDTADSPIVKDENQYLLSLGLSYTF